MFKIFCSKTNYSFVPGPVCEAGPKFSYPFWWTNGSAPAPSFGWGTKLSNLFTIKWFSCWWVSCCSSWTMTKGAWAAAVEAFSTSAGGTSVLRVDSSTWSLRFADGAAVSKTSTRWWMSWSIVAGSMLS